MTLEVMGEGDSMGPLNDAMKQEMIRRQGDIAYDIEWTTLDEYLVHLEKRGVSPNVASFIGAATPREYVIGHEDRKATSDELAQMRSLVRAAMEDGALGVASALIYPPGSFADTDKLIALAEVAAEHDGMYISHVRGEGAHLLEAVGELITIARETGVRAEIYHLKASGQTNWPLFERAVGIVEQARAEGLEITADVYTYAASSTGLNASMPPWVQEGGFEESLRRLAEVAAMRGTSPEETAMDLIVEDQSRIRAVYFSQSEEVVLRAIALPWVSFCSDAASLAPEGVFLKRNPHPRAYGSFARLRQRRPGAREWRAQRGDPRPRRARPGMERVEGGVALTSRHRFSPLPEERCTAGCWHRTRPVDSRRRAW